MVSRYDRGLGRFLLFALPLVLLVLALGQFVIEEAGWTPDPAPLARFGLAPERVPAPILLAGWLLEASALSALFLLVQGRGGAWWLDGLLAGAPAWLLRGPLLVLTVAAATRLPREPWWTMARHALVLYVVAGLVLGFLAKQSGLVPTPRE